MMKGLKALFDSRKFYSALIAAGLSFLAKYLGMDAEQLGLLIAPFVAQILGQAYEDAVTKKKPE